MGKRRRPKSDIIKGRYIYSKNLTTLRQRKEQISQDKLGGIDSRQAKNQTLNDIFDSTWQHGKIWRKGLKQYQHDIGIFCTTEIDGYTDFVFLNRFGRVILCKVL